MDVLGKILAPMGKAKTITNDSNEPPPNPMTAPLREYINLERYQKHQPAFFNCHHSLNLLNAIEHLPPLEKKPTLRIPEIEKMGNKISDFKIEDQLENITLATSHELDKLNQDIMIN